MKDCSAHLRPVHAPRHDGDDAAGADLHVAVECGGGGGGGASSAAASAALTLPLSPSGGTTHIHANTVFLVSSDSPAINRLLREHQRQRGGGGGGGGPRARPSPPSSLRRLRCLLLALALACAASASFFSPHLRGGLVEVLQKAGRGMQQQRQQQQQQPLPTSRDLDFPEQACCIGQQCVRTSRGRHAVVTHVRSGVDVAQLQRLEASMRRTNPTLDLAVMLVRGELGAADTQRILGLPLVTLFYVDPPPPPLPAAADRPRQFADGDSEGAAARLLPSQGGGGGWLKLRAFGLTQYDAVLLVDCGATLTADVSPLFAMPTDFATPREQAQWLSDNALPGATPSAAIANSSTGSGSTAPPPLFLRPCATTEARMLDILQQQRRRRRRQNAAAAAAADSGGARDRGQAALAAASAAAGEWGSNADEVEVPDGELEFFTWYFGWAGGALPFDVWVINMDGAAERLAAFRAAYLASDLHARKGAFRRFPAVNGSALEPAAARLVSPGAMAEIVAAEGRGYRTAHYQLTRGSVGCYLSHLRLYQHVLRGGAQFALVFEDDAPIAPPGHLLASLIDLKPFPDDWDVVLLGHYCHRGGCPPVAGAPRFLHALSFFGTHAYLVHRRGLHKIFAYPALMPIQMQIDAVLGEMCAQGLLNVYAVADALVQQSEGVRSTIQLPVHYAFGEDPYARPHSDGHLQN